MVVKVVVYFLLCKLELLVLVLVLKVEKDIEGVKIMKKMVKLCKLFKWDVVVWIDDEGILLLFVKKYKIDLFVNDDGIYMVVVYFLILDVEEEVFCLLLFWVESVELLECLCVYCCVDVFVEEVVLDCLCDLFLCEM